MKKRNIIVLTITLCVAVIGVFRQVSAQTPFCAVNNTCVPPTQLPPTPIPAPIPLISYAPKQAIYRVTDVSIASYAMPVGTSVCIVTRNIAQSPGIDYNISSGQVVFLDTLFVGDVIQLNCW